MFYRSLQERREGLGGLPNFLKEEEKEEDEEEKKEDNEEKEMEGKRRNEEDLQDSLVVEDIGAPGPSKARTGWN